MMDVEMFKDNWGTCPIWKYEVRQWSSDGGNKITIPYDNNEVVITSTVNGPNLKVDVDVRRTFNRYFLIRAYITLGGVNRTDYYRSSEELRVYGYCDPTYIFLTPTAVSTISPIRYVIQNPPVLNHMASFSFNHPNFVSNDQTYCPLSQYDTVDQPVENRVYSSFINWKVIWSNQNIFHLTTAATKTEGDY
jgi:hypothetical protein